MVPVPNLHGHRILSSGRRACIQSISLAGCVTALAYNFYGSFKSFAMSAAIVVALGSQTATSWVSAFLKFFRHEFSSGLNRPLR
jgi:hypothetical protein